LNIQPQSPIQPLGLSWANECGVELWIKRDDLLHPTISGNKWRKLKYQLAHLVQCKASHIVSFGGGFSNHLHALGYACQKLNIPLTAIVRGHYPILTPMLDDLQKWGVNIRFVDKLTYKKRTDPHYLDELKKEYEGCDIIPEGGSSHFGAEGMKELATDIPKHIDTIIAPVASGGTLAGLIKYSDCKKNLIGVGVLKGEGYLESLVEQFLPPEDICLPKWYIHHGATFGGYAKKPQELISFCEASTKESNVPFEPVYSGKCLYGIKQLIENGTFQSGAKILMLHTGGLQGSRSQA
jgi:1-aminocyclopropane-1-carboxylate deaminase